MIQVMLCLGGARDVDSNVRLCLEFYFGWFMMALV